MSKKINEKSAEPLQEVENLNSVLDLNSPWGRFLRSNIGVGYNNGKESEPNIIRLNNVESMNLCEENALILRPGTILEITSFDTTMHIHELTIIGSSQQLIDFIGDAESIDD